MNNDALRVERMSATFTKYHLPDGNVLHRFTGPDTGPPHDHPWGFTTTIVRGGYEEEVFALDGSVSLKIRRPGETHRVEATTIHRIIRLLEPECWTLVTPGPTEREAHFWDFRPDGAYSRPWHNPHFRKHLP